MTEVRKSGDYTVTQAIHIGDKEIIMGENPNDRNGLIYLVADYTCNELFERYDNCVIGDNFIEIAEIYAKRLTQQIDKVKTEQEKITIPLDVIKPDMCHPNDYAENIENKVVVVKADALRPEYRNASHQIVFITGGNGSQSNARGSAVFCNYLYSLKHTRFERQDIQGVLKLEHYPEWVHDKLKLVQEMKETPFVFTYNDYHFAPVGHIPKEEQSVTLRNANTDRELGISTYDWSKHPYSYEEFYKASGNRKEDLFRCFETGKIYIPACNELMQYTGDIIQRAKNTKEVER